MVLLTGGVKTGANTMAMAPSSTYYDPSKPGYLGGALTALGQIGGAALSGIMAPTGSKPPLQGNITGTYAPPATYSNTEYYPKPGTGVYAPATTNNNATINEIHKSLALPNFGWPGMETSFPDVPHIAPFDAPMPMAYGGPQQSGFTPPPQQAGPEGYRMPQPAPIQQPTGSGPRGQAPVMPQQPMMPREAQQPGEGGSTRARVNTRSGQLSTGLMEGRGSGFGGEGIRPQQQAPRKEASMVPPMMQPPLPMKPQGKPAAPVLPASVKAKPKSNNQHLVPPPPPEAVRPEVFNQYPPEESTPRPTRIPRQAQPWESGYGEQPQEPQQQEQQAHKELTEDAHSTVARALSARKAAETATREALGFDELKEQHTAAKQSYNDIMDKMGDSNYGRVDPRQQQYLIQQANMMANQMFPMNNNAPGQGGGVFGMLGRAGRRYANNGVDPYLQDNFKETMHARREFINQFMQDNLPNPRKDLVKQLEISEKAMRDTDVPFKTALSKVHAAGDTAYKQAMQEAIQDSKNETGLVKQDMKGDQKLTEIGAEGIQKRSVQQLKNEGIHDAAETRGQYSLAGAQERGAASRDVAGINTRSKESIAQGRNETMENVAHTRATSAENVATTRATATTTAAATRAQAMRDTAQKRYDGVVFLANKRDEDDDRRNKLNTRVQDFKERMTLAGAVSGAFGALTGGPNARSQQLQQRNQELTGIVKQLQEHRKSEAETRKADFEQKKLEIEQGKAAGWLTKMQADQALAREKFNFDREFKNRAQLDRELQASINHVSDSVEHVGGAVGDHAPRVLELLQRALQEHPVYATTGAVSGIAAAAAGIAKAQSKIPDWARKP